MALRVADRMRRIRGACSFVHPNRPKRPHLKDAHQFQPNHLEQREERDDQAGPILYVGEELFEPARLGLRQPREQLVDANLDRDLLRRQEDLGPLLRALDYRAKGIEQAEEVYLELRLVLVTSNARDPLVRPEPLRGPQLLALVQQLRRCLELPVFEKAPDEAVARILLVAF